MKKSLTGLAVLLASLFLIVTSCSNDSQITFEDASKPKFTEDGYSILSVDIGKMPEYRTIFPNDWTEEKKKVLMFALTGEKNKAPGYVDENATTTDKLQNNTTVFTYDDIISGRANVTLDPIHWDLTLTAYQTKDKDSAGGDHTQVLDDTKPVLAATKLNVDLTTGAQKVDFNLVSYNGKSAGSDDKATGELDVDVNFYLTTVEYGYMNKVILDVKDESGNSQILANPNEDPLLNKEKGAITVLKDGFGTPDGQHYSVHMAPMRSVKPGNYKIYVTFFDNKTSDAHLDGQVMLQHIENIQIDGGNLTETTINIPEGSFNQPPQRPDELNYVTSFAPSADVETETAWETAPAIKKVTIGTTKDIFAQEVIDDKTQSDYTTALNNATKDNRYNLKLTWKDNSFNEQSFKINLKTCKADKAMIKDVELTYNKEAGQLDPKIIVKAKTGSGKYDEVDDADGSKTNIKYIEGGLGPSEDTLTISLPVGIFCTDIYVTAVNALGEGISVPLANSVEYDDPYTTDVVEKVPPKDPIGMFTVAYKLQYPDKNTVTSIKYGPGPATEKTYFIMAYNYGATEQLITSNPLKYPYVISTKYIFEGWMYDDYVVDQVTPIKIGNLINLDTKPVEIVPDPEKAGKLTKTGIRNTNIEVYGSWTTPITIKIDFPSYSEYKELRAATNQNPYNTVEPIRDENGNKVVSFIIPTVEKAVGKIENMKFFIYDPYADAETKYETGNDLKTIKGVSEVLDPDADPNGTGPVPGNTKTGGTTLIWNVTEFLSEVGAHGDVYRLNISYDYSKATPQDTWADQDTPTPEYMPSVTIDGNFYIKISK